ncbi:MAG: hypothetical protein R3B99_29115, partial [Polyangiales bacterium]
RERPETRALPLEAHGGTRARALRVRLSEEKPETTYLDAVALVVDGVHVVPRACESAAPPAYCIADGTYFVLREGERLDLDFDAPPGGPATLEAHGYYRPHPLE